MDIAAGSADCIVVGGGVVGSTVALNLQAQGMSTIILDPVTVRRAASWGNAGHIATEQVEPLASPSLIRQVPKRLFMRGGPLALPPREIRTWLPFALRLLAASRPRQFQAGKDALRQILADAIPAWRAVLRLAEAPHLLREEGHFILWESSASAVKGRRAWEKAQIGSASFRDASPAESAQLERLLRDAPGGMVRFNGSGQITDLEELAERLAAKFEALGGRQVCAAARQLRRRGNVCQVELADGRTMAARAIVIAAGVQSGALLSPLGHKVPIIAERGYHIEAAQTEWPANLPPVVFEDRAMIVTRFRSTLRASGFVEFASAEAAPDPRKWDRLEQHAREIGLSLGGPISRWMGARPTLPDYLPAIGRSSAADNLFYAFGHQHLGLTLAAATGHIVAGLVTGSAPDVDPSPFSLQRFQRTK